MLMVSSVFLYFSLVTTIRQTHMTPVSFIKTEESHEVKTFKTMESYVRTMESYEVCQLGHHLGHLLELIETSPVNAAKPTVQAAHSCNSCCFHIVSLLSFLFFPGKYIRHQRGYIVFESDL